MVVQRYVLHGEQSGPHQDLERVLRRHLTTNYRRPIADHNRRSLEILGAWVGEGAPLILDAGCGTGESTAILARRHPDSLVVGVDRSLARLRRNALWKAHAHGRESARQGNCALLRADLEDLWRGMVDGKLRAQMLYLLYPNPYPKSSQLKRRWHAHPVFPALIASCRQLELRASWRVYAEEFARACTLVTKRATEARRLAEGEPLSAFERKYWQSGTETYRVSCELEG